VATSLPRLVRDVGVAKDTYKAADTGVFVANPDLDFDGGHDYICWRGVREHRLLGARSSSRRTRSA